jgi:DNA ligase D-like protein (predicted 3'-phosphoesterase)
MVKQHGDIVTSLMRKDLRAGKVFIDWSQNDQHKTTVCAYSLRATERPSVSTPLAWDELAAAIRRNDAASLAFEAPQVIQRVAEKGDLLADVLTLRQHLPGTGPQEVRLTQRRPVTAGKRTKADAASLGDYRRKRHFERTAEPSGGSPPHDDGERRGRGASRSSSRGNGPSRQQPTVAEPIFVIQKHNARRLHYDVRLEVDGVLKSWAVPKGPSFDPKDKRLAVRTEDHPMEYATFEGVIPEGEYGAGEVIVWDTGTYRAVDGGPMSSDAAAKAIEAGKFEFRLDGIKLQGVFVLVRTRGAARDRDHGSGAKENWLLIKKHDELAEPHADPVKNEPASVLSGVSIEDLAEGSAAAAAAAQR